MCLLLFYKYVNGGPTEEVISKATRKNYFGCDSGNIYPTCGIQYYNLNEPVPFSEVSKIIFGVVKIINLNTSCLKRVFVVRVSIWSMMLVN